MIDLNTIVKGSFDQVEAIRSLAAALVALARQVKDLQDQVDALTKVPASQVSKVPPSQSTKVPAPKVPAKES